jgi:hypothetical protein
VGGNQGGTHRAHSVVGEMKSDGPGDRRGTRRDGRGLERRQKAVKEVCHLPQAEVVSMELCPARCKRGL